MTLLSAMRKWAGVALIGGSLLPAAAMASANDQVLVTVGERNITATDLKTAIGSSNYSEQFPSLDLKDQAALRGDMLKRLVAGTLLLLEAEHRGLDQDPTYKADAAEHRTGLLYRAYMDDLHAKVRIPDDKLAEMEELYKDDPSALEPAKVLYKGQQYKILRALAVDTLKKRAHLVIHEDRLKIGAPMDTVLAEADGGLVVKLSDIIGNWTLKRADDLLQMRERLADRIEVELVSAAAEKDNLDVSAAMKAYRDERLAALLREQMEAEWINDDILRKYFDAHPSFSYVPELRHIAQVVVATREEADKLRERALKGETLYQLAAKYSIDPYGRKNNGDMGWLREGTGTPAIEAAIKDLKDEEVSQVIETPRGFHLVEIYGRRKSQHRTFEVVKDRLRQVLVQQKLAEFVNELSARYDIKWNIPMAEK